MPAAPDRRSRALWRRQVVLTGLVAAALAAVAVLSSRVGHAYDESVARQRFRLPAPDTTGLKVALAVAVIVLIALLVATCLHAVRILQLTFRRGENR